jgi:hypothetical protein
MTTKILYISPDSKDAVSYYRGIGVLAKLPNVEIIDRSSGEVSWKEMSQVDIVYLGRPYRDIDRYIAELAQFNNVPLIVDYDDLLMEVPEDSPKAHYFKSPDTHEVIKTCLGLATAVTVSTQKLRDKFIEYNKNIHVVPNAHNDHLFKAWKEHNPKSNYIVYRGGDSHYPDIETHANVLVDLINESKGLKWVFMGLNPFNIRPYVTNKEKLIHVPDMDIMYYFLKLSQLNPKLVIVPLNDNPFNQAKSNIAYLEATYAGAVTVAPIYLPEFNRPGVLNYHDERSFHTTVSAALKSNDNEGSHRLAKECITSKLLLSNVNKIREKIINKILGR